jgi:nitric oxide reductase large subunit
MISHNLLGFSALFLISIGIVLVLYGLLGSSLRNLLNHTIRVPAGTTFYVRTFFICLVFVVLSQAVSTRFDLKPEAHFMEYVWRVGDGLENIFRDSFWILLTYAGLLTILVAVLKPKHDK